MISDLLFAATLLYVGYILYVRYYAPDSESLAARICIGGYIITNLIPCLIIHTQYLKYNKDVKLIIDKSNRIMTISYRDATHSFSFDDIKYVQISMMANLYRGAKKGLVVWEGYTYAAIVTEGGERFIITRLLINDLMTFFKDLGLIVIKKKIYFPFIWDDRYEKIVEQKDSDG